MHFFSRFYKFGFVTIGVLILVTIFAGLEGSLPIFDSSHPSQVQAVPAPVNYGGKDYYRVISTDSTEDTGNEVCAKVGRTCVGYDDESITGYNVCLGFHPGASTFSGGSGDASVTYCNGAPQTGACSSLSNTCLACPSCGAGIACGDTIGSLYREAYIVCGALIAPNVPGAPTVTATSTSNYTIVIDTNGNVASVEYAIQNTNTGNYITAGGGLSGTETWQTYASWGSGSGISVSGYSQNNQNTFRVKARPSGGGTESSFSSTTSRYTLINNVSGVSFSSVTTSSVQVNASGGFANLGNGSSGLFYDETSGNPGGNDNGWTSSTSYTDSGLSVNTPYSYTVTSRNGDAIQSGSSSNSVYTLANTPGTPTVDNPTGTSLDVTIAVNGNPAGTQFAIQETTTGDYVQAGGALGASAVWQTNATWGTVTVTGLSSNTMYTFQVKARNGNNVETAFGSTASGTTFINVPGAPTVDNPALNTLDVTIDENGNPGSVTYAIQETNSGDFVQANGSLSAAEVWQDAATWGTVTVTGLSTNVQYTFRVKARDVSLTETGYSSSTSAYTLIETPTGLSIDDVTTTSVQMSATGSFSNLSSGSSGLEFEELSGNPGGDTSAVLQTNDYTDSGLSVNTAYEYRVRAYNGDGVATVFTSSTQVATLAAVPGSPTVDSPNTSTLDVTLDVNGNPSGTEFALEEENSGLFIQANGSLGLSEVWQTNATWGTVTVTGLSGNTSYAFRVKARNQDAVETAYSSSSSLYTLMPDPTGLNFTNVTTSSIEMAAQGSFPNLSLASSGLSFDETGGGPGATDSGYIQLTTYTDSGLSVNTQYTYYLKARNGDAVQTATVQNSVYTLANVPGNLTVDNPQPSTLDVEITDGNGNPSGTEYALEARQGATLLGFVQAGGSIAGAEVWQTASAWSTVTVTGLSENQTYSFRAKARNGDALETAYSGTTSAYTAVGAPTNFQTFGITVNSMDLSVDAFARDSEFNSGYFFSQDGGPDSGWQSGDNTWTNDTPALSLNTQYTHRVKYRNAESVETAELLNMDYTLAEAPGLPTVSNPTVSTLDVVIDPGSNPASTEFAIQDSLTGNYVQAGLTLSAAAVWQTYSTWGSGSGFTLTGLTENTDYQIRVKARNGDNVETGFSSTSLGHTTAIPDVISVLDTPEPVYQTTPVTFTVDWDDADAGDQVQIHICKTDSLTATSCDGGAWCESVGYSTTDPLTCEYTTQIGESSENYFAFVCDDDDNCSSSAAGVFTVSNNLAPDAPSALFINNDTEPTGAQNGLADTPEPSVSSAMPLVSAICEDPDVVPDILVSYQLQYATDEFFTDVVADSGAQTAMTPCAAGSRSEDLVFPGVEPLQNSGTYYWRLKFWDQSGLEGPYAESSFLRPGGRRRHSSGSTGVTTDGSTSGLLDGSDTESGGTGGSEGLTGSGENGGGSADGLDGSTNGGGSGVSGTGSESTGSTGTSNGGTSESSSTGAGGTSSGGGTNSGGGTSSSTGGTSGGSGAGTGVSGADHGAAGDSGRAIQEDVDSAFQTLTALNLLFAWMTPSDYQLSSTNQQIFNTYDFLFHMKGMMKALAFYMNLGSGYEFNKPNKEPIENYAELFKAIMLSFDKCFSQDQIRRAMSHDYPQNGWWWAGYWFFLGDLFEVPYQLWDPVDHLNILTVLELFLQDFCPVDISR